jgi:hypothetical protein
MKGIPPLPAGRDVNVRLLPLGSKLTPGASLSRSVELPLPLVEQSPYEPPARLEEYEPVDVPRLLFAVQFLRSTVDGFSVETAPHGEGLFRVRSKDTVSQAETLTVPLDAPMKMLKRKDPFSRIA